MQQSGQGGLVERGMRWVDRLLWWCACVLTPAIVIAFSLAVAVLDVDVGGHTGTPRPLPIRVLADPDARLTPAQAAGLMDRQESVLAHSTRLAETPFWLRVPVPMPDTRRLAIELPSRHAQTVTCWNAETLAEMGSADRIGTSGALRAAKSGFALTVPNEEAPEAVLCRARYAGPANISAAAWSRDALLASERGYRYSAGLLEGALLSLAALTIVMALLARDGGYLLLAVWLIANMRVASISIGWDTHWMGTTLPPDWMAPLRQITIALHYLLTYTLFARLFGEHLPQIRAHWLLLLAKLLGLALLAAAVLAPFAEFLPVMWAIVGFGIVVMLHFLARILLAGHGRTAAPYGLALIIVLLASSSEVIAAAFDFRLLLEALNSVTAAIASSLLVILAFANRMRTEQQARRTAQTALRRTYGNTPAGLFTLDTEGRILRSNPALRRMLRMPESPGDDERWEDFLPPGAWDQVRIAADRGGHRDIELRGPDGPGGGQRWFLLRADRMGGLIDGSLQDISERVAATQRLRFLADHDSVSEAMNRRGIERALGEAIDGAGEHHGHVLAYLNLDRFRLVNELYGFETGDNLLKQVALRISATLPPGSVLGRLGSDEFLLLIRDTPLVAASRICRQILARIADTPFRIGNQSFDLRAAAGLIELTPGMRTAEAISTAQRACREAKRGPRLVAYDRNADILGERIEELRLIKTLDSVDAPSGLHLAMQPIMSLHDPEGSLNFEVLMRMRNDDGIDVPVGRALAAAEASGNMAKIDSWVLTRTLAWLAEHAARLSATRFVCVNLSGTSLNDEAFVDNVLRTLERYSEVAPLLCLEITEAVALHDLATTRRFMSRLKAHGVRMALDDFGAGFTSFSYLRELEAEVLKIDGSLIRDLSRHPRNLAIVSAIVNLAQNMGMRTIAEWAEDAETVAALAEAGVDYVQGWAIAPAQSPATILRVHSAAELASDPDVIALIERLGAAGREPPETGR